MEDSIDELARKTGFLKRKRKIFPFDLLRTLASEEKCGEQVKLGRYITKLMEERNVVVRKQSLNAKFNEKGVEFFKKLLNKALKDLYGGLELIGENVVKLKDSTSFQCWFKLPGEFKGSGGGCSESGIKIQYEYNPLTGIIYDLSITGMTVQDTTDAMEKNDQLEARDISIKDLGYITCDTLGKVVEQKANYINRVPYCVLYEKKGGKFIKLAYKELYERIKEKGGYYDEEVYITGKKFKTRLVASLVPQSVYEERVRNKRIKTKKKGKVRKKKKSNLSKDMAFRQRLNLYMTNTDIEASNIRPAYRLRWQIELVFKSWKSFEDIDKVKKEVKNERTLMELYAKLIWIVIKTRLEVAIMDWGRNNDTPMSMLKIQDRLSIYSKSIWDGLKGLFNFLLRHADGLTYEFRKERRKRYDGEEHDCEKTLKYLENCRISGIN